MTIKVTSKNRGAAKRLLSTWHPSTDVRTWTVSELTRRLWGAINDGLITKQGVLRALNAAEYRPEGGGEDQGHGDGREERDDDGEGHGEGQGEGQGEGEEQEQDEDVGAKAAKAKQEQEGGEGEDDEEQGEGQGEGEEQEGEQQQQQEEGEQEQEQDGEQEQEEQPQEDEERPEPQDHPRLKDVLRYIRAGLNVALVGPAGSGKSYITRQVAEALGKDYYVNGSLMSKYDLIGFVDAGGTYHETPAYNAFTKGGLHVFDEFDASAPDACVAFNGMTDDQPYFTFPNGQQPKHEDYCAVACMNTWGNGADADYVGRYKQDAAAMNRFVRIHIDYNESVERAIADKDIVERCHAVRKACELLGIRHVVSTRTIAHMQKARDGGLPRTALDRDILFAGLNADAVTQIKNQIKVEG